MTERTFWMAWSDTNGGWIAAFYGTAETESAMQALLRQSAPGRGLRAVLVTVRVPSHALEGGKLPP